MSVTNTTGSEYPIQRASHKIMGRPPTRPTDLKDGYYLEVRNKGTNSGIKLRRDTRKEMMQAVEEYKKVKDVTILGESKNSKWIDKEYPKKA